MWSLLSFAAAALIAAGWPVIASTLVVTVGLWLLRRRYWRFTTQTPDTWEVRTLEGTSKVDMRALRRAELAGMGMSSLGTWKHYTVALADHHGGRLSVPLWNLDTGHLLSRDLLECLERAGSGVAAPEVLEMLRARAGSLDAPRAAGLASDTQFVFVRQRHWGSLALAIILTLTFAAFSLLPLALGGGLPQDAWFHLSALVLSAYGLITTVGARIWRIEGVAGSWKVRTPVGRVFTFTSNDIVELRWAPRGPSSHIIVVTSHGSVRLYKDVTSVPRTESGEATLVLLMLHGLPTATPVHPEAVRTVQGAQERLAQSQTPPAPNTTPSGRENSSTQAYRDRKRSRDLAAARRLARRRGGSSAR